jgi:hypothetical protein
MFLKSKNKHAQKPIYHKTRFMNQENQLGLIYIDFKKYTKK